QRKIYASFIITGGGEGVYSLYIDAAGSSSFGSFQPAWVAMSNGQGTSYFNATSWSIPGTVGIRNFYLYWEIVGVNGEVFDGYQPILFETTGSHKYYTVLDTPQSPMSEPWTKVLDYACNWASGTTNEREAAYEITEKAYTTLGKNYSGYTHAQGTTFNLTDFLNQNWADCRDMSATVHVFTRAIGGTATDVWLIDGGMSTKAIKVINSSSWGITWFAFHQVAYHHGASGGTGVYDACLKLRQAEGVNERVPKAEDMDNPYKRDLFDSGDWEPDDSYFSYNSVN
ncbi:hypothetical protein JW964_28300, partial [candidate division KSB1 bacterium]|nr:hypothetical protein [candidate division KSB1 bacterium]